MTKKETERERGLETKEKRNEVNKNTKEGITKDGRTREWGGEGERNGG